MKKIEDVSHDVIDTTKDLLAKIASHDTRAGLVIDRTGKMLDEGVDPDVIALQMTKNSPTLHKYTRSDVDAYSKLYDDSKTKVVITAGQTRALIKDQRRARNYIGKTAVQT